MDGVDFFLPYQNSRVFSSRLSIHQMLLGEENRFLTSVYQILSNSASTLEELLSIHEEADMAYVTAFLTGTSGSDEVKRTSGWGKKYYNEGEKDTRGRIHKGGETVGKKENLYRNKKLSQVLRGIGYSYIDVSGHYGAPENTFCVLNYAEDTRRFINDMEGLAQLYNQESVLIVPKKGSLVGKGVPFLYYSETNKVQYAQSDNVTTVVKDFFTTIGKDKFAYDIDTTVPMEDAFAGFVAGVKDSLFPIRSGYGAGGVSSSRLRFRRDVSDYFGWSDEGYFKFEWKVD